MRINAIVLDDHYLFAEGLKALLDAIPGLDVNVTAISHTPEEAMKVLNQDQIDLMFLDLNLGKQDGLEWVSIFKRKKPDLKIIVLTMYDEGRFVKKAFMSGSDGYLLKGVRFEELKKAILTILDGNTFIGSGVHITPTPQQQQNGSSHHNGHTRYKDIFILKHNLTRRELEILDLITQAFSNKEIARKLFISDQTVSVHRKNIMRKLGVSNTVSLVKLAHQLSMS